MFFIRKKTCTLGDPELPYGNASFSRFPEKLNNLQKNRPHFRAQKGKIHEYTYFDQNIKQKKFWAIPG